MGDLFLVNRRKFLITSGAATFTLALGRLARAEEAAPFRIGALNPVTGAGSPYGSGMQTAIHIGADQVNAAGGAAGRKFEVYAEDTQTSSDAAVRAAKKLLQVNNVDAILGTWSSSVSLAVLPLTLGANKIEMNTSGAPEISTIDKKDLVWRYQGSGKAIGVAFAKAAEREGFKRVATMAYDNPSGRGNIGNFIKDWEEMGHKVITSLVYEPKQTSYRSEIQKVLASNPDAIVMSGYLPDTTIIMREWYQMGGTNKWIIPGWAAGTKLVENVGANVLQNVYAIDLMPDTQGDAYQNLNGEYEKKMGEAAKENPYATMCYDMVITLGLAIEHAGAKADDLTIVKSIRPVVNPPGTKVSSFAEGKKLLQSGKKINYEGASGPLDFDEYGDPRPNYSVSALKNGQWQLQYTVSSS